LSHQSKLRPSELHDGRLAFLASVIIESVILDFSAGPRSASPESKISGCRIVAAGDVRLDERILARRF